MKRTIVYFLSGVLLTTPLTACAEESSMAPHKAIPAEIKNPEELKTALFEGSKYTRLQDQELTIALVGKTLYRGGGHLVDKFLTDGRYEGAGEYAPMFGKYKIAEAKICVEIDKPNKPVRCALIFKNAQSDYLFLSLSKGSYPAVFERISIK